MPTDARHSSAHEPMTPTLISRFSLPARWQGFDPACSLQPDESDLPDTARALAKVHKSRSWLADNPGNVPNQEDCHGLDAAVRQLFQFHDCRCCIPSHGYSRDLGLPDSLASPYDWAAGISETSRKTPAPLLDQIQHHHHHYWISRVMVKGRSRLLTLLVYRLREIHTHAMPSRGCQA